MYKDEIEDLRNLLDCKTPFLTDEDREAISAAIAMFEAAEPKDGAAMRAAVTRGLQSVPFATDQIPARDWSGLEALILRMTAAARAEGYAAGRSIARDSILELDRLRSALTSACNALSVYDGQGGTAEAVVTELLEVLRQSSRRPSLSQALNEFVEDVVERVGKGE